MRWATASRLLGIGGVSEFIWPHYFILCVGSWGRESESFHSYVERMEIRARTEVSPQLTPLFSVRTAFLCPGATSPLAFTLAHRRLGHQTGFLTL